jgi:hypothetical protein
MIKAPTCEVGAVREWEPVTREQEEQQEGEAVVVRKCYRRSRRYRLKSDPPLLVLAEEPARFRSLLAHIRAETPPVP